MTENRTFGTNLSQIGQQIVPGDGYAAHGEHVGVYEGHEGLERNPIEQLEGVFSGDAAH